MQGELEAALGDDFLALYYHPELPCFDNPYGLTVWILVKPGTEMLRIRETTLPFWQKHSCLGKGPAVATPGDISRCLLLFPALLQNLLNCDRQPAGQDILCTLAKEHRADPLMQLSRTAAEALFCSAILAPDALSKDALADLATRLSCLAKSQAGGELQGDPTEQFLDVHRYLEQSQERAPEFRWEGEAPDVDSPPHLPNALALIGLKNQLIVVLPQANRSSVDSVDWNQISQLVSDEFDIVLLATPWQLRISAMLCLAADQAIQSFELVWGADLLSDCIPGSASIWTSVAFKPLRVLVEELPSLYCTIGEEELGTLIHDTQNILHNIQLQNEILARRVGLTPRTPPDPLPGKEIPNHQRVAAIISHFRWWLDYLLPAG